MKTIELFQWDLNQKIPCQFPEAHFASIGSSDALIVSADGGNASVPNILLQEPKDIMVWFMRDDAVADSGRIRVITRAKPADYIYTETEVHTFESLVGKVEDVIAKGNTATCNANSAASKADSAANKANAASGKAAQAEAEIKANEVLRNEAEQGRVEAEATRSTHESQRTETFNTNLVSWNGKVDAACKKATDTASKAAQDAKTVTNAAVAKTEEATQAAVAKAQTATDNATTAANKAEAAVAKLPLPLGNTLKGEVEATLVNVDDAWPSPVLEAKVLGQSNQQQEPAPSPENPQEITNLNKAELVITGRNICPDAKLMGYVSYNNGIPVNSSRTQAEFPYVQQSESDGIGAVLNTIKGVTYSIAYLGKATTAAVGIAEYKSVDDVGDISKAVSYARVSSSKKRSLTASIDGVMVFILASQWSNGTTNINTFAKEDMIISIGEPCSTYTPHQSTVTLIDLKGNELLSIPNGVRNEVVIDAEGNVSLIKRVAKYVVPENVYVQDETNNFGVQLKLNAVDGKYLHKQLCPENAVYSPSVNWLTVHKRGNYWANLQEFKQWLIGTEFYYGTKNPETIPLGKVELPALPESTSNIWNNGNIPANVYINYLKDVNIAYGKLESQLNQITMALSMMDTPTVIPEISEDEPTLIPELEESPIEESSITK